MNSAWYLGPMLLHTGDHTLHLVLGSLFLGVGLVSGREWGPRHGKGRPKCGFLHPRMSGEDFCKVLILIGVPDGIRTRVIAVKVT
jgi:hypothetical protein